MAMPKEKNQDQLPKEEADRRRDELARRILRTPPTPRDDSKKKPSEKGKPTK